ncbi:MAG TPA: leucine--tRNA ligase, partial [Verrucomicrobiales bacterium]|nr:leucine--tRNA ligase [Verrucomicrobiales bacterium]
IADVPLAVAYSERHIRVFTTRPDTLFGATYMVLAPEHPLISSLLELARKQPRINGRIRSARVEVLDPSGKSLGIMDLSEAIGFARQRGVDLIEVGVKQNVSICFAQDYGGFRDLRVRLNQQVGAIQKYRDLVAAKSDLERTELAKEKTGVWTGAYATNPVNGEKIPIWIADYVLASYGTGAIMAVPAHDERDWEFAKEFYLPIVEVVSKESVPPDVSGDWPAGSPSQRSVDLVSAGGRNLYAGGDVRPPEACYVGDGFGINSTSGALSLNGLPTAEAKEKIVAWLESKGLGTKTINYKLRDWLFSRQRYWGEPFPIVWKEDANGDLFHEALPESALPVLPPAPDDYTPTADGQPPLARATDWVELPDGSVRETNTMPQWAGSCWYYLRYLDSANASSFVSTAAESYWMSPSSLSPLLSPVSPFLPSSGVDLYVGGTEHAVLHLLYARFWHKVLFDLGHVSTPEPFFKLVNQGLILGEDGQKMSKSRGNVVNPDDILNEYGADALRLFEMFMGPLSDVKPWNTQGVAGVYKFLGRVWRLFVDEAAETAFEQALVTAEVAAQPALLQSVPVGASLQESPATPAQLKALHACIKKVTEDLEGMRFNTAISAMMIFVNEAMTWGVKPVSVLRTFLQLLAPFAPHLAEELWEKLNVRSLPAESLSYVAWPAYDPSLLVEDTLEIPVQVNGKLRAVIQVPAAAANAELESAALAAEKIQPFLAGKTVKKIIVVPRKLVNVIAA